MVSPITERTPTAVTTMPQRYDRPEGVGVTDVGAIMGVARASMMAPLNRSSSSVRTSPMSRSRRLASLSRQRSKSRRMGAGVAAGKADHSVAIENRGDRVREGVATERDSPRQHLVPRIQMPTRRSACRSCPRACSGLI